MDAEADEDDGIEAISKLGFSFKVKEDPSFQPQEYGCISRIENEDPTPRFTRPWRVGRKDDFEIGCVAVYSYSNYCGLA